MEITTKLMRVRKAILFSFIGLAVIGGLYSLYRNGVDSALATNTTHTNSQAQENQKVPVVQKKPVPVGLPGLQTGNAPWIAEITHLRERLLAIGLPALSSEGSALHIHQHLDIMVRGKRVEVPPMIGINEKEQFISSIHVHDATSIIHIESPTIRQYTLGQFFDIWGVRFTASQIGGYSANGKEKLRVFVNGKEIKGNPRAIILQSHQEIVVVFGANKDLPVPMPSSFSFPPGM